jgi:hypothetical protein
MAIIQVSKVQVRRGQELQTGIPQLDPGEFGWAEDTEHLYVGKRISEGAPDDENTRILTENDLNNVFSLIGSINTTTTLNSLYEYRGGILASTSVTNLQLKLDSLNPSLVDFGINASTGTYVQIDVTLQAAINDLFNNIDPNVRAERRRVLEIPAGWFYLSDTVDLPPYTKLVGAGSGLTKIKYTSSLTSMFRTVDSAGNTFEDGNMYLSTGSARDVVIEGMTFEFSNLLSTATSLISLDNVNHALIQDCVFQTEIDAESTTTYGIVNHGIGVRLRGQGDDGTERCRNISIDRCEFNGLLIGVQGTGTVVTPAIRNSVFSNLSQGVVFKSEDTLQGPVNGYIAYNRFQDIRLEAIYAGPNPNGKNGSHLSTQNHFARCGGIYINEYSTSSSNVGVITFESAGNKSVDDYFARRARAFDYIGDTNFYYNPFVKGTTTIADSAVYSTNIPLGTTKFAMIPLNSSDQVATVTYQLYKSGQSRKGTIVANITSNGYVAITDTYTYIDSLAEKLTNISTSTNSGINQLVVDAASYPIFEVVQTSTNAWYLTGDADPYYGKSAFITSVDTVGSTYVIQTDSADPEFDFSSPGSWTLLTSETTEVSAFYDTTTVKDNNFITLTMNNLSSINVTLDYQVNIQT